MKQLLFVLIFSISFSVFPKEWNSLRAFQKETKLDKLPSKDWLKSDRKKNTSVWQLANVYNLEHTLPQEYTSIKQRRDFYKWYYSEIAEKGHEVVWPKMAHFISNKLRLIRAFPYTIFTKKSIKNYAYQGSKVVFNNAFQDMKILYFSEIILKGKDALAWDETILFKEQQEWIAGIYNAIDTKSLETIERMAKGKGFYGLMVAKEIRFQGDISKPTERYDYALKSLRDYCIKTYR